MKATSSAFKKITKWKIGQARQKGSILVEFIMAVPVFFIILWGILNLMTYLLAASQLNQAAYEGARSISKELRGYEGKDIESQADMNRIKKEINLVVRQNKFLLSGVPGKEPVIAYTKSECNKLFAPNDYSTRNKNIFCAYIEGYDAGSGKSHQKVVVQLRSEFQFIGSFIKNMGDFIQVNASSVAPIELSDRLKYVDY
ncbi:TadE/TadG family type IV pilus assembly protein [Bacillus cereus group sp. TH152-1LC]|uniref:TadE/TadG family type IV pilus assembly protein n=1 Tax=Bacillus cereus group sp. TH152-1LC TaxID=3018060 RepID=UPI0022E35AEE|nr:TadE family protein [Bacillus cereus group sp. TH152-1LC]MDA1674837.1 pilus assembly protein [Bacillus cereus group sp. TH152-1LC]